jgi:S1-C subfamily serine protease
VLAVNGTAVRTAGEFDRAVAGRAKGSAVALLVERDGIRRFVAVRLPG